MGAIQDDPGSDQQWQHAARDGGQRPLRQSVTSLTTAGAPPSMATHLAN